MAVREILLYPDPLLKQVSAEVVDFGEALQTVVKDLEDTLDDSPFCVGIAAPQIAYLSRVLLIDVSRSRKPVPNAGRLALINPVITSSTGEILGREGCLSLPHLTANVTRAQSIVLTYFDPDGNKKELSSSDFEARVILHELDHLDGLLFLDRVSSLKTDIFRRKRY
ncbi:MAG: peptide deformylase [Candidatus Obscuribacterales bacterium]|jgi:peptide deformylase|nr:peptide deformylase [Candidatus Obscuribacterales bacterium]